jgi:hypothetical protein
LALSNMLNTSQINYKINKRILQLKKLQLMTITEFERNSIKICHDKKFRSELFKNADSLTWKNCFSILRTTNMFMRPRIQKLNFYDLDATNLV